MPVGTWRSFGALLLGALALGAQELPPALPSSTFGASVDVRVINVEAVVTDAKGGRVHGLSAKDFVLEVDGQEVPIEYFAEMEGERSASPPPSPPSAEGGASPPAALPSAEGRSLLVFIDDLFAAAKQRNDVLEALERDLKLLQPADRMAIAAFYGGRVDVLSGWTGDRRALAAALQAARKRPALGNDVLAARRSLTNERALVEEALALSGPGGSAQDVYGSAAREADPALPDQAGGIGEPRLDSRLNKLSRAATATMRALAPPSGRRTLLLLSGGWPVPGIHLSLAVAANRLGYTVYPVDVQGIDMAITVNDASFQGPQGTDGFISSGWERASQYGMELLARITGGRAILNTAGLTALGRVMEDTSSYYSLGFAPKRKADDRYHPVRVKVRRTGLKVRSQRGFADLSHATQATMAAQGILMVGGDARTKRLVVEAAPQDRQEKTFEAAVTVAIPLADLTPVEQEGKWRVEATLTAATMDKTGSFSDLTEIPLHLTLPQKPAPDAVARYHTKMKLRRVQQRLVVTVRDPLGGAAVWGETEIKP
ncbi:MAG: VWA domain-containing protein [Thermoanaerobaculia bacterium]